MSLQSIVTKTTDAPPVAIVAVYGEVNSETVSEFDREIDRQLEDCGRVVIDCTHTLYVSSSGWRGLIDRSSAGRPAGIAVACMQPAVRDVYDLLGLGHVLSSYETIREAVVALQQMRPAAAPPAKSPSGDRP